MSGPLTGFKIIELAGIGPGPFAGMLLADMGAEVIRVDRAGGNPMAQLGHDAAFRNRRSIVLDLKSEAGAAAVVKLCEGADALFEGFRPGVAERLGVGPEQTMAANPKLVYGRMTGWGQTGPLSQAAGHDINYISISGAAAAIGSAGGKPVVPLNLIGDFGGGSMYLVMGMLAALLEAQKSGQGQVVDAAMTDGAASLMSMFYSFHNAGMHSLNRGTNMLDGGLPIYDYYETSDGKAVSIGSLEPQFYIELVQRLELPEELFANQQAPQLFAKQRAYLSQLFASQSRDYWCEKLEGSDVCFAPVLDLSEAPQHPHNKARNTFVDVGGNIQPAPAPKFSRTVPSSPTPATPPGTDTQQTLLDAGFSHSEIETLLASGVAVQL
jgi:alpha-methylacyl-CoA racemase